MVYNRKRTPSIKGAFETNSIPVLIEEKLQDICQDDAQIKDVLMEISKYELYGCRVVAMHRCIDYLLKKEKDKTITINETDSLIDYDHDWTDGTNDKPIYDIINPAKYVNSINKKYNTQFSYEKISSESYNLLKEHLINNIKNDIPMVIKVIGSNPTGFHFINVIGYIETDAGLFFKANDTYRNYDGYTDYWIYINDIIYFEFFVPTKGEN